MTEKRNETPLMQKIQVYGSYIGWRLFRNQVGTYKILYDSGETAYLSSGLAKGSGDLIGWRPVVITQEMVGMTLAQFVSCEVKDGKAKPEEDQLAWIEKVRKDGGLAFVARSEADLQKENK